MLHGWLLLLLSLPPRPSSLRVRAWRRLRGLGAVPLKSSAYLLPDSPDRYEQFQWLAQEIQRDGGEATLLRVDRIENMKQPDVVRLFQEARNHDYAALAERYRKLLKGRRPRLTEELARLAREMDRITEIDFFEAPGRREVSGRAKRSSGPRGGSAPPAASSRSPGLKGRRWVAPPPWTASLGVAHQAPWTEAEFVFASPTRSRRGDPPSTWPAWTASRRGLHVRDPLAPHQAPRSQLAIWPRSSTGGHRGSKFARGSARDRSRAALAAERDRTTTRRWRRG
jgi:hypothetical protein